VKFWCSGFASDRLNDDCEECAAMLKSSESGEYLTIDPKVVMVMRGGARP
jgi:hypothetical protein